MRSRALWSCLLLAACAAGIYLWRATRGRVASATSHVTYFARWNPQAAAGYLDRREVWWQDWPVAQKDHGTICISCHTVVTYAMARPALRHDMSESGMAAPEKIMMDSVEKRVSHWSEMDPFYSEAYGPGKAAQSHATEAVLNAVILASYDTRQTHLRPITRTAFDEAWALQQETGENAGGWIWQDFNLGPWESAESAYQGATMLMLEAASAPDGYASEPGSRQHLDRLQEYLQRQYAAQPLMSQLYILWASDKVPGLLTGAERTTLLETLQRLQQADGGWRLSSLDKRKRLDHSPEPTESDGVATGLTVLVMEESGTSPQDKMLKRGLEWLEQHQEKDGNWHASSINKKRNPESNAGPFMDDAATGYAVLALENARGAIPN
jgi:squalene-hopene/tetraprenyl-beta-curcumene cyclase